MVGEKENDPLYWYETDEENKFQFSYTVDDQAASESTDKCKQLSFGTKKLSW